MEYYTSVCTVLEDGDLPWSLGNSGGLSDRPHVVGAPIMKAFDAEERPFEDEGKGDISDHVLKWPHENLVSQC